MTAGSWRPSRPASSSSRPGGARVFEGRYSAYRKEKALAIAQQAEAFERQQAELERLQRFVDKFRAGTRSRQAASRAKRIERIELVDRPRQQRSLAFGFPKTVRPGRDVLEVEGARVEAGDKLLVRGARSPSSAASAWR